MYFIPDLRVVQEELEAWEEFYGQKIIRFMGHSVIESMRSGIFMFPNQQEAAERLPEITLLDTYEIAKNETGAQMVALGSKKSDSTWRRLYLENTKKKAYYPMMEWKKIDVAEYFLTRKLAAPTRVGFGGMNGTSLNEFFLYWCYDNARDDFEIIEKTFPLVRAVIKHRELYNEKIRINNT